MRVKCDAVTAAGNPCNNWAVGEFNGRNFCHLKGHRAYIESLPARKDEMEAETETPEPEVAEATEVLPEEPLVPTVEIDIYDLPLLPTLEELGEDYDFELVTPAREPWMDEPNAGLRYRARKKWLKEQAALAFEGEE